MIVTCPTCSAKYRVRDEAVPVGGAELECPECGAHFIAHPPSTDDLNRAIDRLTDTKEVLEAKIEELNERLAARVQEVSEVRADLQRLMAEGNQAIKARDEKINQLQTEAETVGARARKLEGEVKAARSSNSDEMSRAASELGKAKGELSAAKVEANAARAEAQGLRERLAGMSSLHAELELARQRIKMLETSPTASPAQGAHISALEGEVRSLRDQLAKAISAAADTGPGGVPPEVVSMITAMGPMAWGLEKAIEYLEPFAKTEQALAGHVRQLRLLAAVIKKLTAEVGQTPAAAPGP